MPMPRKLAAVRLREGNPRHRPIPEGIKLPPVPPNEPDWADLLPGDSIEAARIRDMAQDTWHLIVGELEPLGVLARVDDIILTDTCIIRGRLWALERDISQRGTMTEAVGRKDRGMVRNQSVDLAMRYRQMLQRYLVELGLTPLARDKLNPRTPSNGETAFDA
jgi:P27 family predicted phage terminase small subunit